MLGYWAEFFYPSYMPGGLVTAKGSSIIGFSFPAAMGLKLACPERPVVALIGDGGFLYGAQEMATCRRHGIAFPLIVVNNAGYGMIDLLQRQFYGRGDFETDLVNPDLPALAASFSIAAERVESPEGLEQALRSALTSKEIRLIEVVAAFRENPFAKY
jgi:acetolactate synthase-1/2/3 large subunit